MQLLYHYQSTGHRFHRARHENLKHFWKKIKNYWLVDDLRPIEWRNYGISWFFTDPQEYMFVYYRISCSNGMLYPIYLDYTDGTTFWGRVHLWSNIDHRPINLFLINFFSKCLRFSWRRRWAWLALPKIHPTMWIGWLKVAVPLPLGYQGFSSILGKPCL